MVEREDRIAFVPRPADPVHECLPKGHVKADEIVHVHRLRRSLKVGPPGVTLDKWSTKPPCPPDPHSGWRGHGHGRCLQLSSPSSSVPHVLPARDPRSGGVSSRPPS